MPVCTIQIVGEQPVFNGFAVFVYSHSKSSAFALFFAKRPLFANRFESLRLFQFASLRAAKNQEYALRVGRHRHTVQAGTPAMLLPLEQRSAEKD